MDRGGLKGKNEGRDSAGRRTAWFSLVAGDLAYGISGNELQENAQHIHRKYLMDTRYHMSERGVETEFCRIDSARGSSERGDSVIRVKDRGRFTVP